jgi:hypothetical protein
MLEVDHDHYVSALAEIDQKAKAEWATKMEEVLFEGNKALNESHSKKTI